VKRYLLILFLGLAVLGLFLYVVESRTKNTLAKPDTTDTHSFDTTLFADKKIGMSTGTIWEPIIWDVVGATPIYYRDTIQGYQDILAHEIFGHMTDLSAIKAYVNTPEGQQFTYVELPLDVFSAPMGAASINEDIIRSFNSFLSGLSAEGTLKRMQEYWFDTTDNLQLPLPIAQTAKGKNVLNVATSDGSLPFAFYGADGELRGYSIELITRYANQENLVLVFSVMPFGSMLPTVINKENDIAIADITITEERMKSVFFTEPIFYDQAGIIYLK